MKEVRAALTVASFKVADFASHSFHIGAATTASPSEVGQGFDLDNVLIPLSASTIHLCC